MDVMNGKKSSVEDTKYKDAIVTHAKKVCTPTGETSNHSTFAGTNYAIINVTENTIYGLKGVVDTSRMLSPDKLQCFFCLMLYKQTFTYFSRCAKSLT